MSYFVAVFVKNGEKRMRVERILKNRLTKGKKYDKL